MAENVDAIRFGANGRILLAEVGTTAPTTSTSSMPAGWEEVGFISDAGVGLTDGKTSVDVNVWQRFYPVKRKVTNRTFTANFAMRQWDAVTLPFAFGGGSLTEPTAGNFRYEAPEPDDLDDRAMCIEWTEGDVDYRFVIPRGNVSENMTTTIARTAPSDLPIAFGVLGEEGEPPFYFLSNDPALEAAS